MNTLLYIYKSTLIAVICLFFTSPAFAQSPTCTPIFGGGQLCTTNKDFTINKQVQDSQTQTFRSTLSAADQHFVAGDTVTFRIVITNTANKELGSIKITDVLPAYLEYVRSNGAYTTTTRTFSTETGKLAKGTGKTYTLVTKVVANELLPTQPYPFCMSNQAKATLGTATASDIATICIAKRLTTAQIQALKPNPTPIPALPVSITQSTTSKGSLPVYQQVKTETTPQTGPETVSLLSLLGSFGAGVLLRKRS